MHCIHRGKGEAILFIHGMPTNCTLWDGVIDQLLSEPVQREADDSRAKER